MKDIIDYEDLAIAGALPAFDSPLHVGRPNIAPREQFDSYVDKIYESRWLTNNGPLVRELESEIALKIGVKNCIAVCNGTIALELAIRALELKGEVIVPSYTFVATAHALNWQGIRPVFADIDPKTHCLDPISVERAITSATTGVIGVHLWGKAADTEKLEALAKSNGLKVIYDAAHAFGCKANGRSVGSFGECEVFSFHATKFFNSFEGGAIVTENDDLAEKIRLMRNFGFSGNDKVIHPGTNGKMSEICAAMGLSNLKNLDSVLAANEFNYRVYREEIGKISGLELFCYEEQEVNNFQYIVLEVGDSFPVERDQVVKILEAENVLARKYFWPGCHRMSPYHDLQPNADLFLANTVAVSERVVVLPTGPSLSGDDVKAICAILAVLE